MNAAPLLVEIGTEELPPKSLRTLAEAFAHALVARLDEQRVAHGATRWYATPRRLAVHIEDVATTQPDTVAEKLGPAVAAAFDANGRPSAAALGFARGCGVGVDALLRIGGERGERLAWRQHIPGQATAALLPTQVEAALAALPIAKRMRWGARRVEFVRPVHWVVLLHGDGVVAGEVLGITSGRETRGHRVHGSTRITLAAAGDYERALRDRGHVIADYRERRSIIAEQVRSQAATLGGDAVIDDELLDEVCSLVEWPCALAGRFEPRFLQVPAEALISSMKQHQKYFHVVDAAGALLPYFVTVANIVSTEPQKVIDGNERVIRPRLSDAAFFYEQDLHTTLAAHRERLRTIVFQTELGTLWDKTERVARLAHTIGSSIGADPELCSRAAALSKSDLVSEMVLEFDELQGIMGSYYAVHDGEAPEVAAALGEQYLPRHAGDALAHGGVGIALALADRLDTLTGIFGIGQPPSGSRDPFALRRAALGVLRTIIENALDLDLLPLIEQAAAGHQTLPARDTVVDAVRSYVFERLRAWYADAGIAVECFLAVQARNVSRPLDFDRRVRAVASFAALPEAAALAAANKRVANILAKQAPGEIPSQVDPALLHEAAELRLAHELDQCIASSAAQLEAGDYTSVLGRLATLRTAVDAFFEQVLVNCDDARLRANRYALLARLRAAFLGVADVSLLAVSA